MRCISIALLLAAASLHADVLSFGSASPVNAAEGSPFSGPIATISDDNTNELVSDLSGMIHWGDGTSSVPTITSNGGGVFGVLGTHTYVEAGSYTIGLDVRDGLGDTFSGILGDSVVFDVPLSVSSLPPTFTFAPGTALSNVVLLSFSDENPFSFASDFTGAINWGDGTNSLGTITSVGGGVFELVGSHTYVAPGSFTIGLTVNDVGGSTLTTQASAVGSVPEPGSFGLICVGLALAGYVRFRRG